MGTRFPKRWWRARGAATLLAVAALTCGVGMAASALVLHAAAPVGAQPDRAAVPSPATTLPPVTVPVTLPAVTLPPATVAVLPPTLPPVTVPTTLLPVTTPTTQPPVTATTIPTVPPGPGGSATTPTPGGATAASMSDAPDAAATVGGARAGNRATTDGRSGRSGSSLSSASAPGDPGVMSTVGVRGASLPGAVASSVGSFVPALALALLIAGFLCAEALFDRRDPKLAGSPLDDDGESLPFE